MVFETKGQQSQRQMHNQREKNAPTPRGGGIPSAQYTDPSQEHL